MFKINDNFLKLRGSYLFSDIAKKVNEYSAKNPNANIIRLGIGDVTRPLAKATIDALHSGADEMAFEKTFRGYGPEQGYDFLRQAILDNDYKPRGVDLDISEIFVSNGSKDDCGSIGDILSTDNVVAVCDPVYPVYVDTNVMAGRAGEFGSDEKWSRFIYLPCTKENGFIPSLPTKVPDIIYLCFPNNPTGSTLTKDQLKVWVDYALKNGSLILYDGAYEAYISEEDVPHSIYEIEGAKKCAIEFHSFSKTAGFTGTRCAYTIVPKELKCNNISLNDLWFRRQGTKTNGVAYVVQRAAEAIYSKEGQKEIKETISYYMENAKIIREGLKDAGFNVSGGINAPYIWLETPMKSWDFFDKLLNEAQVVGTPGCGFGPSGEGYFRLTAFGNREKTIEAIQRIKRIF